MNAAEQALTDAFQSGNEDAIDEAREELEKLQEPVKKTVKVVKKYIAPPQFAIPDVVEGNFDAKGRKTWKQPLKTRWGHKKVDKKQFPSINVKAPVHIKHTRIKMEKVGKSGKGFTVVKSKSSICGTVKLGTASYRKTRSETSNQREQAHERLAERSTVGSRFTCPCKAIMKGLVCEFGDKCAFAHTPEQLTVRMCHFGDACKCKSTCRFGHPCDHEQKTAEARKKMAAMMP